MSDKFVDQILSYKAQGMLEETNYTSVRSIISYGLMSPQYALGYASDATKINKQLNEHPRDAQSAFISTILSNVKEYFNRLDCIEFSQWMLDYLATFSIVAFLILEVVKFGFWSSGNIIGQCASTVAAWVVLIPGVSVFLGWALHSIVEVTIYANIKQLIHHMSRWNWLDLSEKGELSLYDFFCSTLDTEYCNACKRSLEYAIRKGFIRNVELCSSELVDDNMGDIAIVGFTDTKADEVPVTKSNLLLSSVEHYLNLLKGKEYLTDKLISNGMVDQDIYCAFSNFIESVKVLDSVSSNITEKDSNRLISYYLPESIAFCEILEYNLNVIFTNPNSLYEYKDNIEDLTESFSILSSVFVKIANASGEKDDLTISVNTDVLKQMVIKDGYSD